MGGTDEIIQPPDMGGMLNMDSFLHGFAYLGVASLCSTSLLRYYFVFQILSEFKFTVCNANGKNKSGKCLG